MIEFYSSFITAGTHKAESIKVAEAAKVIENTQRDINIAFINELSFVGSNNSNIRHLNSIQNSNIIKGDLSIINTKNIDS